MPDEQDQYEYDDDAGEKQDDAEGHGDAGVALEP